MKDLKTIAEMMPSRRELMQFGGLGVLGAAANAVWPLKLHASSGKKTNPRGNARNVVFYEFSGALSHVDSFDFKENKSTLEDFGISKTPAGIYAPYKLFPRLISQLDKVAIVRSFV